MYVELPKSQKKIARELIENSLQIECARFLKEIENSISDSDREAKSPHEAYLKFYAKTKTFDKHIAWRYDDLRGSRYAAVLVGLLLDEIITPEDLNPFDKEVREKLLSIVELYNGNFE